MESTCRYKLFIKALSPEQVNHECLSLGKKDCFFHSSYRKMSPSTVVERLQKDHTPLEILESQVAGILPSSCHYLKREKIK